MPAVPPAGPAAENSRRMTPAAPPVRRPFRLWRRLLRFVLLVCGGFLLLLVSCQSRLIYFPRPYQPGETAGFIGRGGRLITAETGEGRQTAWLIPPAGAAAPERLWIVCGGNATRAIDMESLCRSFPFAADAWLLVDYPGYGDSEGSPRPDRIREGLRALVPAAARSLNMDTATLPERGCVFGNSLGCAAGLIAAGEFRLRRVVLCAPFTSTMDMAAVVLRLPLGFLVWHRYDNRAGLSALRDSGGHAWIFHGDRDAVIPVSMSRTLAAEFPDTVTFTEVPGGGHGDLVSRFRTELIAAMQAARVR
jgi:uncharacterized protein